VATTTEATTWGRNNAVRNSDIPLRFAPREMIAVRNRASTTGMTA
jgi:hypothetical protein